MVPTAVPPKHPSRARRTRVGRAYQRQWIFAYCAGDSDVGDRPSCIASVGIVRTTGMDLAIEDSRGTAGVIVANLSVERGATKSKSRSKTQTRGPLD